jgi:hypothetical protein
MRSSEEVKKLIKSVDMQSDPGANRAVLNDLLHQFDETQDQASAATQPTIRRTLMKSPITKLSAAALVIIAASISFNHFVGSSTNVALAEVSSRFAQVDYVHVYWLKSREDDFFRQFEGWYAHGKLVRRGDKGGMTYDDSQTQQSFDEQGRLTGKEPSLFAEGKSFFELFSGGLLSDENKQLERQMPTRVGDDFLIYELDAPPDWNGSEWIETISVTVGKNSLLPIQMKVYEKDSDDYDLVMFDYEAAKKPPAFFEPPALALANGQSELVLEGEEVLIDIEGSLGLKQAILRLHSKYDGPADDFPPDYIHSPRLDSDFSKAVTEKMRKEYKKRGGPIFRLEVSFVTDEGHRSGTHDFIVLRLNETGGGGVGAAGDEWPDGKYRNIKFSPILKSTDRKDTYTVEMRCWLKPKES